MSALQEIWDRVVEIDSLELSKLGSEHIDLSKFTSERTLRLAGFTSVMVKTVQSHEDRLKLSLQVSESHQKMLDLAIKALDEAMTRIASLEQRIYELEGEPKC